MKACPNQARAGHPSVPFHSAFASYCSQCGEALIDLPGLRCAGCGYQVSASDKFCGKCGRPCAVPSASAMGDGEDSSLEILRQAHCGAAA
jgi:hypothetical protein